MTDRKTERQKNRDKETERQKDRKTERQKDRKKPGTVACAVILATGTVDIWMPTMVGDP
jgi:hypothetical protein